MRLNRIVLKNFKGIRDLAVDFKGPVTSIHATNGAGKTTLFDAFNWLLFGKDSLQQANFEIKPFGEHNLEHEVEAVLDMVTLQKRLTEKWTKKRGSSEKEFTGHETAHFIDGVPVGKREYDAKIAALAPEEIFRLLTNPRFFSEHMPWQKRREILMQVCGDVTDQDVIESDVALSSLPEILGARSLEDHRKVIAAQRKKINDELSTIPARISELDRLIVREMVGFTGDKLTAANVELSGQLQDKERERLTLVSGGAVVALESNLLDIENKIRQSVENVVSEHRKRLRELNSEVDGTRRNIGIWEAETDGAGRRIVTIKSSLEDLRNSWIRINSSIANTDDLCPTCKQPLPEEQIEEARASFNLGKSIQLQEISGLGDEVKRKLNKLEKSIVGWTDEIKAARAYIASLEGKIAYIQTAIEAIRPPEELTQERDRLQAEIEAMKATASSPDTSALDAEIQRLNETIAKNQATLATIHANRSAIERIEQLKKQEQDLASQFAQLDGELFLTESFVRRKVEMLESKINGRFKQTTFRLFSEQINGGLFECCEIMHDGVAYPSMNNAARINCGLDVINTLSGHYGFSAPIWIDNAESIVDLLPTKAQQIRLIVSEQDQTFRIEHREG